MLSFLASSNPCLLGVGPRQGGDTCPVGALTSGFWLWGGGDVLRGQDLGEAHGSANPLSQVGSRWVVGTHAVLGADGVVSLHALHLSGEKNATAACESEASVPRGHPAIPHPHPSTVLKEVTVGAWEVTFWHASLGFWIWWLHSLPTLTSYRRCGVRCDAAAAAAAHLWLFYLTADGDASGTLHCKHLPAKSPAYGTFKCIHLASVRGEVSLQLPHVP